MSGSSGPGDDGRGSAQPRAGSAQTRTNQPGAAQSGRGDGSGEASSAAPPPVPRLTLALMAIFLVGGSVGLTLDWPPGPAHLDWGVWTMVYGGYAFVVAATLFYARTGR